MQEKDFYGISKCHIFFFLKSVRFVKEWPSGGCAVGARLWRSPKSSGLLRGQYLDGWPLSRVLFGASNRWAGGWTLRVGFRNRNIDYKDQVSEGMTDCIGTDFPRCSCALVRMRYSGGWEAAANFTKNCGWRIWEEQVAKWDKKEPEPLLKKEKKNMEVAFLKLAYTLVAPFTK